MRFLRRKTTRLKTTAKCKYTSGKKRLKIIRIVNRNIIDMNNMSRNVFDHFDIKF